jgi:hypothetical protein
MRNILLTIIETGDLNKFINEAMRISFDQQEIINFQFDQQNINSHSSSMIEKSSNEHLDIESFDPLIPSLTNEHNKQLMEAQNIRI